MSSVQGISRKVLLVEDEIFVRALIEDVLVKAGYEVQTSGDVLQAKDIAKKFEPEILVTDINLGGLDTGIDLAHAIKATQSLKGLVFITNVPDPKIIGADEKAIPKGSAYLDKNKLGNPGVLVEAIEAAVAGKVPSHMRDDKAEHSELPELSRSQIEVLRLIAEGLSNQQIADRRNTGLRAVENLLQRAYEVLGIDVNSHTNVRVKAVLAYLKAAGLNRG